MCSCWIIIKRLLCYSSSSCIHYRHQLVIKMQYLFKFHWSIFAGSGRTLNQLRQTNQTDFKSRKYEELLLLACKILLVPRSLKSFMTLFLLLFDLVSPFADCFFSIFWWVVLLASSRQSWSRYLNNIWYNDNNLFGDV